MILLTIGNVDYQLFDETFVIPAGQSSYTYMTTILSNPEHEPTEWFSAAIQYVSGSEVMIMGPNATVSILDTDGKQLSLFFRPLSSLFPPFFSFSIPSPPLFYNIFFLSPVPTISFNPVMYLAIEGSCGMSVIVTISAVTSQPIPGSTNIRIRDVVTPGAMNSATSKGNKILIIKITAFLLLDLFVLI